MVKSPFYDRTEAGQQLARQFNAYANRDDVLVLALPRGGVPVAYEISQALKLALDICLVRKLGEPDNRENAIGAVAANGVRVLNYEVIRRLKLTAQAIADVTARELRELRRRAQVYRGANPQPIICDRIIILVDDGLATGATMEAAVTWLQSQHPRQLVVAVPIASLYAYQRIKAQVNRIVCLYSPRDLYAIGLWYENFDQVTDAEVCALLSCSTVVN